MKTQPTETTQPTPRSSSPAPAWTPGPWEVVRRHPDPETAKNYVEVLGPNQCGARGVGYSTAIAEIYNASGSVESANARLIAAAPEMAEALWDLLALTEALRDHVKHNLNGADLLAPASPRIAKARALLARINGNT